MTPIMMFVGSVQTDSKNVLKDLIFNAAELKNILGNEKCPFLNISVWSAVRGLKPWFLAIKTSAVLNAALKMLRNSSLPSAIRAMVRYQVRRVLPAVLVTPPVARPAAFLNTLFRLSFIRLPSA